MGQTYDYRNCQSLFGYAEGVHQRSGGICQLCGCGVGSEINFDLWRQMTVEHLVGASQGGYYSQILDSLASRFPGLSKPELEKFAQEIDCANTVTACHFCNSMTSRNRAGKSMRELLNEALGGPEDVVGSARRYLQEVLEKKKRGLEPKLESVRCGFRKQVERGLLNTRRHSQAG